MLTAIVPVWRLRLRLRPTLRFPAGIARRARSLAGVGDGRAGRAGRVACWSSPGWPTRTAAARGAALTVYSYGWQVFVSVYAVLAIPVAISAFPVLSARQGAEFDAAAASATRATALASWLGAALLVGAAFPVARAFPALTSAPPASSRWRWPPSRPAWSATGSRRACPGCCSPTAATGWRPSAWWRAGCVVIVVDLVAVPLVPACVGGAGARPGQHRRHDRLGGRAADRGRRGPGAAAALAGCWRALGAGLAGAVAGAAAGLGVTAALRGSRALAERRRRAALPGLRARRAFLLIVALLDGGDLRSAVARGAAEGGVMTAPRVGFVLGTTAGGTGRHVAMLARACARGGRAGGRVRAGGRAGRCWGRPGSGSSRWRSPTGRGRPGTWRRCGGCGGCWPARGPMWCTRTGCGPGRSPRWRCGRRAAAGRPALVVTVHNAPPAGRGRPRSTACSSGSSPGGPTSCCASRPTWRPGCAGSGARRVERAVVPAPAAGRRAGRARRPSLTRPGRPVVLGVGRLAPQKGFDTLIAAASAWSGRAPAAGRRDRRRGAAGGRAGKPGRGARCRCPVPRIPGRRARAAGRARTCSRCRAGGKGSR